jgi:glycosyltransferase involved in cell wall biosynthesis
MKGVPLLLAGLGEVPALHLLLCGQGMEPGNEALRECISAAEKECPGIENRVHLAGHRADLERVLPGLDMYVSASLGESFPNVVAEALACEVPVVATDVGASRALLVPEGGEAAGRIVAPFDGAALGRAMAEMAALPASAREELGRAGRARVAKEYSWAACARRYAALYRDIA